MSGTCDECGKPATAHCDAIGCAHKMCDEHTTRGVVSVLDPENPPLIPTYCPQHARLAKT